MQQGIPSGLLGFEGSSVREALMQIAEDVVLSHIPQMERDVQSHLETYLRDNLTRFKGPKGDKGERGERGEKGDFVEGPKGDRGEPGYTPRKGKDYFDGKDVDIEEVAKLVAAMLESEEDEEVIPLQNVAGLAEEIVSIKDAIRGIAKNRGGGSGGGGMGQVQHELKSVSSATTTVTTSYKIAGAGTALWLSYNGQALAKGTDYTVGGDYKTITLLFVPQDSTVILLEYIRS